MTSSDDEFLLWLVNTRSRVQSSLLRLHDIHCDLDDRSPKRRKTVVALLLGAGFSLWRAVFLAKDGLNPNLDRKASRKFLVKIIADNTIGYFDDKNRWSFGYYVNNAAWRIERIYKTTDKRMPNGLETLLKRLDAGEIRSPIESRVAFVELLDAYDTVLSTLDKKATSR